MLTTVVSRGTIAAMDDLVRDRLQIKTRVKQDVYDALRDDGSKYHRSVSASVAYILEQWAESRDNQK